MKRILRSSSAFTLVEVIVVIIVIGAMAALAVPRYQATMESVKAREGVSLLTALIGAQKRYALENDGVYTSVVANLDLTVPAPKYFNAPTLATSNPIASIQRNNTENGYGNYTLTMTDVGVIGCSGGAGSICTKIGY